MKVINSVKNTENPIDNISNKEVNNVGYLIVAPLSTPGQKKYYLDRKKMLKEIGYKVYLASIPFANSRFKILSQINLLSYAFKYRKFVKELINKYNINIIEFQNVTALFQDNYIFSNHKTIISFDHPLQLQYQPLILTIFEKFVFNKSNLLICRSKYAYNLMKGKYKNMYFLPHAIYLNKIITKDMESNNLVLSYCSPNNLYLKGLDILIKTWGIIRNKKSKLIIAGPTKKEAEDYLYKFHLKIPQNVQFIGLIPKSKLNKYILKSRYIINSSRMEEFGRFTIEALSLNKIVFSTPTNGSFEILSKVDRNLLSSTFESEDLAKTIMNYKLDELKINPRIKKMLSTYSYSKVKTRLNKIITRNLY